MQDKNLSWLATPDGKNQARVMAAVVSTGKDGKALASRIQSYGIVTPLQDPVLRNALISPLPISVRFPRKAQTLRIVVENEDGGRMGTIDVAHQTILDAPAEPTPLPQLQPRRPAYVPKPKPVTVPGS